MAKNNILYFMQYGDLFKLNMDSMIINNLDRRDSNSYIKNSTYLIREDGILYTNSTSRDFEKEPDAVSVKVKAGEVVIIIDAEAYVIKDKAFAAMAETLIDIRQNMDKKNRLCQEKCSDCCCAKEL